MSVPRVSDLLGIIHKIAPPAYAEEWDNPGLQVGDPSAPVPRIMVALDAGAETITWALRDKCQLLVTHHPLIFRPLRNLTTSDAAAAAVMDAVRGGLAVIAAHTNYDSAPGGLNDLLARRLQLRDTRPLKVSLREELVKLAVFIPRSHQDVVMEALFRFSGFAGTYRDCSFRSEGVGTFTPLEGAKPFLGEVGRREQAEEVRLEVLLRREDTSRAVQILRQVHPYEEPAYDLYPLLNSGAERGLGRIGELESDTVLAGFCRTVKEALGTHGLRAVGDPQKKVRRVALCTGSGASLLHEAARRGADVLVTGDVKYHEARTAASLGIGVVDAGHFATEVLMVEALTERLGEELAARRMEAEIVPCRRESDPFWME